MRRTVRVLGTLLIGSGLSASFLTFAGGGRGSAGWAPDQACQETNAAITELPAST